MDPPPEASIAVLNITKQFVSDLNLTEQDFNTPEFKSFLEDTEAQLLLFSVLTVLGICANFILIYLGFFTQNNNRKPSNIIIANWALANFLHLVATPLIAKFLVAAEKNLESFWACILSQSGYVCKSAEVIFLILLLANWYLSAFNTQLYNKIENKLTSIILFLWIVAGGIVGIAGGGCLSKTAKLPQLIFEALYFGMASILIKSHTTIMLHRYNREMTFQHPTLILNLVSLFLFLWGPDAIMPFIQVGPLIPIIVDCLDAVSPVFVVAVLFGFEEEFKEYSVRLVRSLRGRKRKRTGHPKEVVNLEESTPHVPKVENV